MTDVKCIICGCVASPSEVHPPKDRRSWTVVCNAARIRNFEAIQNLSDISDELLAGIRFHRECRANFTNIKALRKLEAEASSSHDLSESSESPCSSSQTEKRLKRTFTGKQIVYTKNCVFCDKESKYKKGSRTRETLTQVVELRTDKKLRQIVIERGDKKIIGITSRDIVAAEACYDKSCYLTYTRLRPDKRKNVDKYIEAEKVAYQKLYSFIREDLF